MKRIALLAVIQATLFGLGCQKHSHPKYTLVSDRPWPIGEARTCTFDGEYREGHCFPPTNLSGKSTSIWWTLILTGLSIMALRNGQPMTSLVDWTLLSTQPAT